MGRDTFFWCWMLMAIMLCICTHKVVYSIIECCRQTADRRKIFYLFTFFYFTIFFLWVRSPIHRFMFDDKTTDVVIKVLSNIIAKIQNKKWNDFTTYGSTIMCEIMKLDILSLVVHCSHSKKQFHVSTYLNF